MSLDGRGGSNGGAFGQGWGDRAREALEGGAHSGFVFKTGSFSNGGEYGAGSAPNTKIAVRILGFVREGTQSPTF
jgi:hypothetical protein